jgi:DNA-directed RNA polymerase beta' subunit
LLQELAFPPLLARTARLIVHELAAQAASTTRHGQGLERAAVLAELPGEEVEALRALLREQGPEPALARCEQLLQARRARTWALVEEVTRGHPVLLNRAPTLHRMGVQAFEPVLIEGNAVRIHPLVCKGFNADFDGDQMAVHLPLSLEARAEAEVLLTPAANLLNPASGQPIVAPSQDIVLGCHYLTATLARPGDSGGEGGPLAPLSPEAGGEGLGWGGCWG